MFSSLLALGFVTLSGVVNAQTTTALDPQGSGLSITQPNGQIWWVQGASNTLAWTCRTANPSLTAFTVVVSNQNQQVLAGQQAFLSNLKAADCSETVMASEFTPAQGYQIALANVVNLTDIYAISDPFEIKKAGSAFPSVTTTDIGATPTSSGSGSSNSASGSGASPTPTGGASRAGVALGFAGAIPALLTFLV